MAGGQRALVGERGPEMIIPRMGSEVISNRELGAALGGGGANVNQSVVVNVVNASGKESKTSESQRSDGSKQIEIMIGESVSSNIHRGGTIDKAIRNSYGLKRPGQHGV